MTFQVARRRFTVDEFQWMARVGIIEEEERVELIDGEIVEMSPINPPHQSEIIQLTDLFTGLFREQALVSAQGPAEVDLHSQPQPDLLLLRRRKDFYRGRHPTPEDIYLAIEVSDSTLAYDRKVKAPLYARTGIQEHWRIELKRQHVVVHREPAPTGYQTVQIYRRGESIALLAFPDQPIAIDALLG